MKILVIGGTYFCGKAFVEMAAGAHTVSVLNRGNLPLHLPAGVHVTEYKAERHDKDAIRRLRLPEFDAVVDFCAYREGDIAGLLEALDGKVKQYIFISTCDVYPHVAGGFFDEESGLETFRFPGEEGDYVAGKVALEKELRGCRDIYGIAVTSLRPTVIYGPNNYAPREGMFFTWIKKSNEVLMPADANARFQFVYVKDVAAAALAACGNPKAYNRAYNLAGTTLTYDSLADVLAQASGANFKRTTLPVLDIVSRQIPMPFPMTDAETIEYAGTRVLELGITYTDIVQGMQETYKWFCEDYSRKLMAEIDRLFDENKARDAEKYMLHELVSAENCNDLSLQLLLYNELIGYYRQTSETQNIEKCVRGALELVERMGLGGTVSHATTALNAANAYRSVGRQKESMALYELTESIYSKQVDPDDMRYAGLLNNVSLLYQDMGRYEDAGDCQQKALQIAQKNHAGFEIAVGLSNLANTYVAMGDYQKAARYGEQAVEAFKERNYFDAHYCAALSALGMCSFYAGEYGKAVSLFEQAMSIVESTLGRNLQYEKLQANRDMAKNAMEERDGGRSENESADGNAENMSAKENTQAMSAETVKGMELCRAYFEEVGKPMLEKEFAAYLDKIAVGLVGEGSECFGYDDACSRDHDWGPGFCLWVDRETYDVIGEKLEAAYNSLPAEFMGCKTRATAQGKGRRGVHVIGDFYTHFLGTAEYEAIDWAAVEDASLAAATNGEVFADPAGEFTAFRELLKKGYPERMQYLKLAEDAARFSQTAQYNALRCLKRGDELTSRIMAAQGARHAMLLLHHIHNVFPPHDKWLKASCLGLPMGEELVGLLEKMLKAQDAESLEQAGGDAGQLLADILYSASFTSDVENYIGAHADELAQKAGYALFTDAELVDRIAELEFEAFDKVKNEGGRAYCQNDWPTFSVMRKSQYLTWDRTMLLQYLYDFNREYRAGHNLITEKYGRMMASTDTKRYAELEVYFPELTEEKKAVIEQIVAIQMRMVEEFAKVHPKAAGNARSLHTYEDNLFNTSYETYLRGEISTYSDKMLQLYGRYVVRCYSEGINIAEAAIGNTAKLYGYKNIDELEKYM